MALKVHHLRPAPGAKTAKTRVGRGEGGKGGKTAGRGTKGTGARKNIPENFEGGQMPLHMRVPKLRGFKNPFRVEYQIVNLDRLGELFPEGGADRGRRPGRCRCGPLRAAGQDPRHRRDLRRGAGHRQRVLRLGQGEDRRSRWEHHRALRHNAKGRPILIGRPFRIGMDASARPGHAASWLVPDGPSPFEVLSGGECGAYSVVDHRSSGSRSTHLGGVHSGIPSELIRQVQPRPKKLWW